MFYPSSVLRFKLPRLETGLSDRSMAGGACFLVFVSKGGTRDRGGRFGNTFFDVSGFGGAQSMFDNWPRG